MENQIDWSRWEGAEHYVKLKTGKPKLMTFSAVKQTETEIKKKDNGEKPGEKVPCLLFSVTKEDGEEVKDREFSVTSKLLARALRPFVELGFPFSVKITAFGERFDREYKVEDYKKE